MIRLFSHKSFIARVVLFSFTYTFVLHPAVFALTPEIQSGASVSAAPDPILQTDPFQEVGKVTEGCYTGSKTLVVYVQDLHCHPGVQRNINELISSFAEKYPLKKIYVEGAPSGTVDLGSLMAIPGPVRSKALDRMLNDGLLSGAVYYAATRSGRTLFGLEDDQLYRANRARLAVLSAHAAERIQTVNAFSAALERQQNGLMSSRVRRLNAQFREFDTSSRRGFDRMVKKGQALGEDISAYPNLDRYVRALDMARDINQTRLSKEFSACFTHLRTVMPYGAYRTLASIRSLEDDADCARFHDAVLHYAPEQLSAGSNLRAFLEYRHLSSTINPILLLEEKSSFERAALGKCAETLIDRDLLLCSRMNGLLGKFAELKLSSPEYTWFKNTRAEFKAVCGKYLASSESADIFALMDNPEIERYFETNIARNRVFDAIIAAGAGSGGREKEGYVAVLNHLSDFADIQIVVAGGFHSDFTMYLKDRGISYLTVTPAVSSSYDPALYDRLMSGAFGFNDIPLSAIPPDPVPADPVLLAASIARSCGDIDEVWGSLQQWVAEYGRVHGDRIKVSREDGTIRVLVTRADQSVDACSIVLVDGKIALVPDTKGQTALSTPQTYAAGRAFWKTILHRDVSDRFIEVGFAAVYEVFSVFTPGFADKHPSRTIQQKKQRVVALRMIRGAAVLGAAAGVLLGLSLVPALPAAVPAAVALAKICFLSITTGLAVDMLAHEIYNIFFPNAVLTARDSRLMDNVSGPYLGIRAAGIFAPLNYWRSEDDWGVGDMDTLLKVVEFAKKTGQSIVQLLPLNLPVAGNSPYSNASTYIFDPAYIGMKGVQELLGFEGAAEYRDAAAAIAQLSPDIAALRGKPTATNGETRELKYRVLRTIFAGFLKKEMKGRERRDLANLIIGNNKGRDAAMRSPLAQQFKEYCIANEPWLSDHLLFMVLMKEYGTDDFRKWPKDIAARAPPVMRDLKEKYKDEFMFEAFVQWMLAEQLKKVIASGKQGPRNVDVMLDQPFAFGNADVWANLDAFLINPDTLKRDYTQGAPPHRIDVPQFWQFYLLDLNKPAAKQILLDRLNYLLRFCSLLRIDHLLGYFQLYYLSEDVSWDTTLGNLGVWDSVEQILHGPGTTREKRERIYAQIVDALKTKLPVDTAAKLFDERGNLRTGSVLFAARRNFDESKEYAREQDGWFKQWSTEHEQNLLYCLLNPNEFGSTDYLDRLIEQDGGSGFLKADDSIRIGMMNPGLGEEIVSAFMTAAQRQGKSLILENLGLVPHQVSDSLQQLGTSEFKPGYFGYQVFKGDQGSPYWIDRMGTRDYACFATHDTVPIGSWWAGKGKWSKAKNYFNDHSQKWAVIRFLRDRGFLRNDEPASPDELTPEMHRGVLDSVASTNAGMTVFMMPDVFGSGEEGILNIPGSSGFWTTLAPVTIEDLLRAADDTASAGESETARQAADLLRLLGSRRERNSFEDQVRHLDPSTPHILNTHPAMGPGAKQIRFVGEDHLLDVIVYGNCQKAEIVLMDGDVPVKARSMIEIHYANGVPDNVHIFRVRIPASLGTTQFRVRLDGTLGSESGWLIGQAPATNTNPISSAYGQPQAAAQPRATADVLTREAFERLFSGDLRGWLKDQRWFMEKANKILDVGMVDYFELPAGSGIERIFGFVCAVTVKEGRRTVTHKYYVPLAVREVRGQAGDMPPDAFAVMIEGKEFWVTPAEHMPQYQTALINLFGNNASLATPGGNRVVFHPSSPATQKQMSGTVSSVLNLMEGASETTSNVLTSVTLDNDERIVVKTLKKGEVDIEPEMYVALDEQGYEHIPGFFGHAYLETPHGQIPLCIVMSHNKSPPLIKSWEARAGFNIWSNFLAAVQQYAEAGDDADGDALINDIDGRKIFDAPFSFLDFVKDLGRTIGGFNIALAKCRVPGFGTRTAQSSQVQDGMVVQMAEQIDSRMPDSTRPVYQYLRRFWEANRGTVLSRTSAFMAQLPSVELSRIHGDMQLDQVLFNEAYTLVVLDLGGAPLLDIDGKRARGLAMQDIAGLIRAFGYIKFAILKQVLGTDTATIYDLLNGTNELEHTAISCSPEKAKKIIQFANKMEQHLRDTLVDEYMAYYEDQKATGLIMPQWDRATVSKLVDFCVLARALYEMNYEISARPQEENVLIPLEAIYRLTSQHAAVENNRPAFSLASVAAMASAATLQGAVPVQPRTWARRNMYNESLRTDLLVVTEGRERDALSAAEKRADLGLKPMVLSLYDGTEEGLSAMEHGIAVRYSGPDSKLSHVPVNILYKVVQTKRGEYIRIYLNPSQQISDKSAFMAAAAESMVAELNENGPRKADLTELGFGGAVWQLIADREVSFEQTSGEKPQFSSWQNVSHTGAAIREQARQFESRNGMAPGGESVASVPQACVSCIEALTRLCDDIALRAAAPEGDDPGIVDTEMLQVQESPEMSPEQCNAILSAA